MERDIKVSQVQGGHQNGSTNHDEINNEVIQDIHDLKWIHLKFSSLCIIILKVSKERSRIRLNSKCK